ncbi:c-type cytochrome [Evansella cellulosilytica]|uniref:Cytochrome c class I n=1 Tax=Evansella cellulosilytica (strain ATCC 21833 / DSM 2522 / FERM P-1141 / JCM 9156 / N-4) TaxID=649639 RepID=E6TRJ6_EVAC2|nr:cytochrome c [Evansella cellulosilytica]ADU31826.1 cytochrome c class I [Evansella cellulosilytica DSM 2522]
MKKLLMTLIGTIILTSACGTTEDEVDEPQTGEDIEQNEEEIANTSDEEVLYDASSAEAVYIGRCSGCHGQDLGGRSGGPGIIGLSKEEVLSAIEEGPGIMPKNVITGEEAENVAAWVADQQ